MDDQHTWVPAMSIGGEILVIVVMTLLITCGFLWPLFEHAEKQDLLTKRAGLWLFVSGIVLLSVGIALTIFVGVGYAILAMCFCTLLSANGFFYWTVGRFTK